MSNNHYQINEEIELTINVKVKIKDISNYQKLSEEEIKTHVNDFKNEIKQELTHKLINEYYFEEITEGVDGWNYEVLESNGISSKIIDIFDVISEGFIFIQNKPGLFNELSDDFIKVDGTKLDTENLNILTSQKIVIVSDFTKLSKSIQKYILDNFELFRIVLVGNKEDLSYNQNIKHFIY